MKRAILCGVVALATAALLTPTAAADKPTKEPLPSLEATGQFCPDFQVQIRTTTNKEVIHIFSSGVSLITGALKVEVTNLTTGKTLALNIPGPGKFSADGSTLTGGGPWLIFGEAGQLPARPRLHFSRIRGYVTFPGSPSPFATRSTVERGQWSF
jgi:hypothetical protein